MFGHTRTVVSNLNKDAVGVIRVGEHAYFHGRIRFCVPDGIAHDIFNRAMEQVGV